ncbi:MAG: RNA-directed DNA polymerase [Candidatus Delongbacteria bacterium]
MKRTGNLINKIADTDNLKLAFYKAAKGKADKNGVIKYRENLVENLLKLRNEILSGNVDCGNYHYFKILDPKERNICAAEFPERVLHHAIMNQAHDTFEQFQIFDSYATRIDKGTHKAIEKAKKFNHKYDYFLKLDVRKYFDSIDHEILMSSLEKKFKDCSLLRIFNKIISSYEVIENKGVPIGNLTSQYFANHYLAGLDHYIKEELKNKAYIRYMDDMVLWHNDKEYLKKCLKLITGFLKNELKLDLKISQLNKTYVGVNFLGYKLKKGFVKLNERSKKRFVDKMRSYAGNLNTGKWSQEDFQRHIVPLISYTDYATNIKPYRSLIIERLKVNA